MAKITATFILRLIALCLSSLNRLSSYIISIVDLCDDGEINDSVKIPEWVRAMRDILDQIDNLTKRIESAGNILPTLLDEKK